MTDLAAAALAPFQPTPTPKPNAGPTPDKKT
jgi:hypothetical protein